MSECEIMSIEKLGQIMCRDDIKRVAEFEDDAQDMDKENKENNAVEEDEANFEKGKNEEEGDDTEEEMESECLMDDEFCSLQ
ncbi:unnamed protein product [Arctia plantaginis]|uniref:Uncharacterized protein n=1 Tax=Arctia plantaginis TaxID=874455 RepID=A0A8S0ZSL0_ARCPL|nr:unnamed protein product [Arctia plantaginis]